MESNVRTLAMKRAPLVRFMGTKNASSVRKNRLVYGLGTKLPFHTSGTIKTLYGVVPSGQIFFFSYPVPRYEKKIFFVPGYEKDPFRTAVGNRLPNEANQWLRP